MIRFLFLIISIISLSVNYLIFNSNTLEKYILYDARNDLYNFKFNYFQPIHYSFPTLASNTVPLATYISRYATNEKDFDFAIDMLNISLVYNPYSIYSKYLLARNYIYKTDYIKALEYLEEIFQESPKIEATTSLYIAIISELKDSERLKKIFPVISRIKNKVIWDFYINSIRQPYFMDNNEQFYNKVISRTNKLIKE